MGGQGEHWPTQVLADQLTLSQPEGADYFLTTQLYVASYVPGLMFAKFNYIENVKSCYTCEFEPKYAKPTYY